MCFGKNQRVAGVDRIYIEKADHAFVLVDFGAGELSFYYTAKNTGQPYSSSPGGVKKKKVERLQK